MLRYPCKVSGYGIFQCCVCVSVCARARMHMCDFLWFTWRPELAIGHLPRSFFTLFWRHDLTWPEKSLIQFDSTGQTRQCPSGIHGHCLLSPVITCVCCCCTCSSRLSHIQTRVFQLVEQGDHLSSTGHS